MLINIDGLYSLEKDLTMELLDYSVLIEKIENYDKIIVLSHHTPDFDALGSQLALYQSLKASYPHKTVLAGGEWKIDEVKDQYTELTEDDYKGNLVIVTDTGAHHLISDKQYVHADHIVAIDHHFSRQPFAHTSLVDNTMISACLLIYDLIMSQKLVLNQKIAQLLLYGIVSDSGRFRYKNTNQHTFKVVSHLLELGADLQEVYARTSSTSLEMIRYRGYVMNTFKLYKGCIAYMVNTKEMIQESGLTLFEVSRGMVNSMADIEGIEAWMNFSETEDGIKTEFRSKKIPVVSIAKAHGGGGHELACGCTTQSLDQVEDILEELYQVVSKALNNSTL